MRNHRLFLPLVSFVAALLLLAAAPASRANETADLERKLAAQERTLGPDHPDLADTLSELVALHYGQGRYDQATSLARRALAIREKRLGPEHPDTAASLNNLALLYKSQAQYAQAEPLYKRALAIDEKAHGPDHPDVATDLNNLAALYTSQAQYEKAEPLYKRVLAIDEKAHGPDHPEVATDLNNLATLYTSQAQYEEAEPLYKRALAIREKRLGPDHPDTAQSLNNLADLYTSQAQYARAEPLAKRALAMREKQQGPDHPDTAQSLNTLAFLYENQARYEKAGPLYQRALEIREKRLGPDHPDTAQSLNNLAGLYDRQAQYEKAEPLYRRALAIDEQAYGPDHPEVATDLNNLAGLYRSRAQYEKAGPLYQRALAIREKRLGPDHPDTAASLDNLAGLYDSQAQYAQAEPLHTRALAIREKRLGPDHPDVATGLNNLAGLHMRQAQYEKAESLYRRALAIDEKAHGPDHPEVATDLNNLALLYKRQARYAQAEPLYKRTLAIASHSGRPEHLWSVQGNLGGFYKDSSPDLAIFYAKQAVNTLQGVRSGNTRMDMAAQRSFLKDNEATYAFLADLLFAQNRLVEGQQALDMLKEAEYHEFNGKSDEDDPRKSRAAYSPREAVWERGFRDLAADLAKTDPGTPEYAALNKRFDAWFEEVKRAFAPDAPGEPNRLDNISPLQKPLGELGEGTVLIQYLMPQDRLWLLVTTPKGMQARRVDVKADALKRKIAAFRQAVVSRDPNVNEPGKALFDLLIKPAAEDLNGAKTLMLAPDGALRYLPFAALHDGERYLAQRHTLAHFTDMTKNTLTDRPKARWNFAGFGVSRGGEGMSPLPAVAEELAGIRDEAISGTIRLDGDFTRQALQDALKQSPPVVHLASHFVFKEGDEQASFLLTGDGRLTLRDIRDGYRFTGVDLVALSACETGVGGGADENGREVEGLGVLVQRQGAKGVLASLWPVNDASTGRFMRLFYGYRQQDKLTKAEALRKAQLAFIEGRTAAALAEVSRRRGTRGEVPAGVAVNAPQREAASGIAHPYHWAPFILMGNWL